MQTINIKHPIQKHIVQSLTDQKLMRFRDLRKKNVDTNLLTYHLKLLVKDKVIQKVDGGYSLDEKGLIYADRIDNNVSPKITVMFVIQNSNGDILLQKLNRQPYIDKWTLPNDGLNSSDVDILSAASRMARETLDVSINAEHAGDCYVRLKTKNGAIMSSTLAHIFRCETDGIVETDRVKWARPHKLSQYDLAPAVEEIMTRTFFRDEHFFEEFRVDC